MAVSAEQMININIQKTDFSVDKEYQTLKEQNQQCGAIVTFTGLVRDSVNEDSNENPVSHIELQHYPQMTESHIETLANNVLEKFSVDAITIIHRVGKLSINEQIVFVGVAGKHRNQAFLACEMLMDYLKSQTPFWKKEVSIDGEGNAPVSYTHLTLPTKRIV